MRSGMMSAGCGKRDVWRVLRGTVLEIVDGDRAAGPIATAQAELKNAHDRYSPVGRLLDEFSG